MLSRRRLVVTADLEVDDVRCGGTATGWSEPEVARAYGAVFVRSGCFRRAADGIESVLDPTTVYFVRPGDIQRIAHPVDGGDRCTAMRLSDTMAATLWGGEPGLPDRPAATSPGIDLAARRLLAVDGTGPDPFETCEQALRLLVTALERAAPDRVESGRPATEHARARIVNDARELVTAEPTIGLVELARRVAVSPHHLSRIFHRGTGETLSRYRNRVRVRLALERLADGDGNLSMVASDLGFADAAHMARTVRTETGDAPSSLRGLLSRSPYRRWSDAGEPPSAP